MFRIWEIIFADPAYCDDDCYSFIRWLKHVTKRTVFCHADRYFRVKCAPVGLMTVA